MFNINEMNEQGYHYCDFSSCTKQTLGDYSTRISIRYKKNLEINPHGKGLNLVIQEQEKKEETLIEKMKRSLDERHTNTWKLN